VQRLRIDARDTNGGLWIEPDPEGEFVRAEEAIKFMKRAIRLIEAAKDALPSDDAVYLRIKKFLAVEANAVL